MCGILFVHILFCSNKYIADKKKLNINNSWWLNSHLLPKNILRKWILPKIVWSKYYTFMSDECKLHLPQTAILFLHNLAAPFSATKLRSNGRIPFWPKLQATESRVQTKQIDIYWFLIWGTVPPNAEHWRNSENIKLPDKSILQSSYLENKRPRYGNYRM